MRGLKSNGHSEQPPLERRIPHGMRGLKFEVLAKTLKALAESHPAWDAWIEIVVSLFATTSL